MSKCDVSIRFDRDDRTYAGGEPITGRAVVRVNDDVSCNGITLTHQWKTHGRGNVDAGPKETVELAAAGPLVAGETLELPFSVTSATHPMTYHGHLINVDHYVSVKVNIPWTTDPKAEEEYLHRPGQPPAQFTGSRSKIISLAAKPQKAGPLAIVLIAVVLVIFIIPVISLAICLLPVGLIAIGIAWMMRRALTSRLGEVQLSIPDVVVAPGEDWNFRIQFRPQKQFRINGIFLTLTCKESAKSGGGTQATTHRHLVFEHKAVIRPAQILEAEVPVDESFSMVFPATDAYSFDSTDNNVSWTAEVRIDIPRFPDWTTTQVLQVVPIEFLKQQPRAVTNADVNGDGAKALPAVEELPAAAVSRIDLAENPLEDRDNTRVSEITSSADPISPDLQELLARIGSASRHGPDRGKIAESVRGDEFDATIVVDRVNSSMGLMASTSGYDEGKTVVGAIQGTDQSIQVITPESRNREVANLRRGDVWQLRLTIDGWDSLYNRLMARQLDRSNIS